MAMASQRRPANVPGPVFVDDQCICCCACMTWAEEHFDEVDGDIVCVRQPTNDAERRVCAEAAETCPVDAIGGTTTAP